LPDELARLWFLVRRVAGLLDRAGESFFRHELDVSLAQFLVLSVVEAHPGDLSQQAIAERLGLTKGTVSRQIETAVAAGLMRVERSQRTRRENNVTLTPAGKDLVARGDTLLRQAQPASLPTISEDDMTATLRVLASLRAALEASS
jgi:DNA-binding MarR family transcriptional regulator